MLLQCHREASARRQLDQIPGKSELFFYDGRYYTVRDDHWFYAARLNTPWVAIAIGKVPRQILAVPVAYYRVPPGHMKHNGAHCPPGQVKKGRCWRQISDPATRLSREPPPDLTRLSQSARRTADT